MHQCFKCPLQAVTLQPLVETTSQPLIFANEYVTEADVLPDSSVIDANANHSDAMSQGTTSAQTARVFFLPPLTAGR